MRTIARVVLLSLCAWWSGRAAQAQQRRGYEPFLFAAVPLHAPVPVLHVLSPAARVAPAAFTRAYMEPAAHESRPRPRVRPYDSAEYEDTASSEYASASYSPRPLQPPARPTYEYAVRVFPSTRAVHSGSESSEEARDEAPAVLYARPSLSGGYTYRKISDKRTPPKKVASSREAPVIIKIHKHRITKS